MNGEEQGQPIATDDCYARHVEKLVHLEPGPMVYEGDSFDIQLEDPKYACIVRMEMRDEPHPVIAFEWRNGIRIEFRAEELEALLRVARTQLEMDRRRAGG